MQRTSLPFDQAVDLLGDRDTAQRWLASLGVQNTDRGFDNLLRLSQSRLTLDLLEILYQQLGDRLPQVSDADMALNNLERYVAAARNPLALGSLFERDHRTLFILLTIFSNSQFLSDYLVREPESFDLLRMTEGQPVAREVLVAELCSEIENLPDEVAEMAALRRIKQRELLRIAFGDLIREQTIGVVTRQISYLADAICEAALRAAYRKLRQRRGTPRNKDGTRCRFVVLAMGKLGGEELNYSSDIDLMFLYEGEGKSDGKHPIGNQEFFQRLGQQLIKILSETTDLGTTYRVDMRLRPEGNQAPIASGQAGALIYYDTMGRTWERQAFVKARAIAGDLNLGTEFLGRMEPWIWRRYLTGTDIAGIKALKRRIEQRARTEEGDTRNVKTGHGGIRDIEFAIQFLQLLNGGDLPGIRSGNTLDAIVALEQDGCLTHQERSILEENYAFLRQIEHRLQVMFDLQTHLLPKDENELRKLAFRMGYRVKAGQNPLREFQSDLVQKTAENHKILAHLLHDAFGEQQQTEPEVDLVLDPSPTDEMIQRTLGKYGFADLSGAYRNLMSLGEERVRFLSTRRCRHFMAAIAARLLEAIATTPDVDSTLVNLVRVSDSLGGKGVLWELFSFNPPSLELYVRLCGASNYLANILITNPGMIDELMDSLVLDKLPSRAAQQAVLDELTRGAEDLEPILHSFKNTQHLRVGARDILGKDDIQATHAALANVAEVVLQRIAHTEFLRLTDKYGEPSIGDGPCRRKPCELLILALGKMGGREPNYHSDMDIVFLYEAEGNTQAIHPGQRTRVTTNQHFFGELAQHIIKVVNHAGPHGRLFELDPRLRPTGRSGTLAISLAEFAKYYATEQAQLWERQALCKARVVYGSTDAASRIEQTVQRAIMDHPWKSQHAAEIRATRRQLEKSASRQNLKRGPGGTVDIEFLVQMLQLKHAAEQPEVLVSNTLKALTVLRKYELLSQEDFAFFDRAYRFLRNVEARLRLMNTTARHDLPTDESVLNKLAWLLGHSNGTALTAETASITRETRQRFERLFDAAEKGTHN